MNGLFAGVSESRISRAILNDFQAKLSANLNTDAVVVGAGPSGLMAARELAKDGFRVLIIEANNYLGGGFWIGGFLMNGVTVRAPGHKILEELEIPFRRVDDGLYLADGPHACAKLIAAACEAGVTVLNMTRFEDVVLRERGRVAGVVINWTPVAALPRAITCVDPIALETKVVIDASGHDAQAAAALAKRNLLALKGTGGMWVEQSEDALVEKTGEVHPGLIVCGMAVSAVYGLARMGPTFGGMLFSGRKAAKTARELLLETAVEKIGAEKV